MVNWNSQLRRAAREGSLEQIVEALKQGADINAPETAGWGEPWTPLKYAVQSGQETCVAYLLSQGATPTMAELRLALEQNHPEILGLLLEYDVPLEGHLSKALSCDIKWARSKQCPPFDIHDWYRDDAADFLNAILISYGVTPYLTILHHPAVQERGILAQWVLDSGLLCASYKGIIDAVLPLFALGADANATTTAGHTALHFAVSAGHLLIVKILLQHGADINHCSPDGFTPLISAILRRRRRVAWALLESGADVLPQHWGEDAESLAASYKMERVLREIQRRKGK